VRIHGDRGGLDHLRAVNGSFMQMSERKTPEVAHCVGVVSRRGCVIVDGEKKRHLEEKRFWVIEKP
jgi:hypothetical protein